MDEEVCQSRIKILYFFSYMLHECSTFYFHHCTIFCWLSTGFETFVPVYFLHIVFLPFTFTSQFYSYLFFIRLPCLGFLHTGGNSLRLSDLSHHDWFPVLTGGSHIYGTRWYMKHIYIIYIWRDGIWGIIMTLNLTM